MKTPSDFQRGFEGGKKKVLKEIDDFIKSHTFQKEGISLIRILPFEWDEIKEKLK